MSHIYYNWLGNPVSNTAPINVPLWFIRDLLVVILFTPILYFLIKKFGLLVVSLLGCLYVSDIWPVFPGLSSISFFFFSIGAYFSIWENEQVFKTHATQRFFYVVLCASLLLLFLSTYYDGRRTELGTLIYPFFVVTGTISLILGVILHVRSDVQTSPESLWLAHTTFFVFAAHNLILPYVKRLVYLVPINDNYYILSLRYFIVPVFTIILVLCFYHLLNRYLNRILLISTGNR